MIEQDTVRLLLLFVIQLKTFVINMKRKSNPKRVALLGVR